MIILITREIVDKLKAGLDLLVGTPMTRTRYKRITRYISPNRYVPLYRTDALEPNPEDETEA
jgi:hypothetical protein